METENLGHMENRIEPKIRVSRDGKWIIMRVPGIEQAIIKPVAYFKAIIAASEKRKFGDAETIKG